LSPLLEGKGSLLIFCLCPTTLSTDPMDMTFFLCIQNIRRIDKHSRGELPQGEYENDDVLFSLSGSEISFN
jgi:hypothetical protein